MMDEPDLSSWNLTGDPDTCECPIHLLLREGIMEELEDGRVRFIDKEAIKYLTIAHAMMHFHLMGARSTLKGVIAQESFAAVFGASEDEEMEFQVQTIHTARFLSEISHTYDVLARLRMAHIEQLEEGGEAQTFEHVEESVAKLIRDFSVDQEPDHE